MSQEVAVIRPYVHNDDNKLVRFMVGKAAMEPLAVANNKAFTHWLTLSLWTVLSAALVQFMKWWPDPNFGYMSYLRPLPIFAAFALPLIFAIDWHQRPHFEEQSKDILKRPDIANIAEYYARTPSSGLWLYERGQKFIGLVAVDASPDSLVNSPVSSLLQLKETKSKSNNKRKPLAEETARTAVIRHLYVEEPYRVAFAQDDLISFAAKSVFETPSGVQRLRVTPSPISTYLGSSLRSAGFDVVERGAKVGILGWTTLTYELTREKWEASQKSG